MTVPHGSHPLDWHRIFLGDETPLFLVEIAFRTSIIFVFTLMLLRILGKRGLTQLSLFEVTIIIGLGAAVGDPMFQDDVPLVHSMVVISVIVTLYRLFLALLRKNETFERFVSRSPSCLVEQGVVDLRKLEEERLSQEELFEILRMSGIEQLGEVKRAYLEQSGKLSVFAFPKNEVVAGLRIVPPRDLAKTPVLHADKDIAEPGVYACRCCGRVLERATPRTLPHCEHCARKEWEKATKDPLGAD